METATSIDPFIYASYADDYVDEEHNAYRSATGSFFYGYNRSEGGYFMETEGSLTAQPVIDVEEDVENVNEVLQSVSSTENFLVDFYWNEKFQVNLFSEVFPYTISYCLKDQLQLRKKQKV